MWKDLPRRKKQVLVVSVSGALVLLLLGLTAWVLMKPPESYRPGEAVAGITSALARELPDDRPRVSFSDVSASAGISFRHFSGKRSSQLPEDMGSGAAWGDYDGDGWVDLFIANKVGPLTLTPEQAVRGGARSALYRNNGNGTFTEVSEAAGIDHRGWAMAGAWGDFDNDGALDLLITAYGRNTLYRNNGDGTFTDVTREAGLSDAEGFWAGAAWGDYDRDGHLDLYITGYVQYDPAVAADGGTMYNAENPAAINPSSFPPERNLLYRNNGNGTFTEVGELAGVANPQGRSLSAVWFDVDGDGWPDLYVANDVSDNVLFRNLGDGTFRDISHASRVADYRGAMGITLGDWNGDAAMDLFVTHWIAQENALYTSRGTTSTRGEAALPTFVDNADRFGLGQISLDDVGWGTAFFDYDNDGRLDLFVANGSTLQHRFAPEQLVPMRSRLFWNAGAEAGFYDVSRVSGPYFEERYVGRGAAVADYDNDGNLDIVIVNHGGPAVLLRNEAPGGNNWLKVDLRGRRSNSFGVGARLRLVSSGGVQVREVGAQGSYLSQNSLTEHFGLGTARVADTLEIVWPSGVVQYVTRISANQSIRVEEAGTRTP
jgi:enediyne biosynthesis protein E4